MDTASGSAALISRKTAAWIAIAASASFIIALLLMAFGPDLAETTVSGPSAFSASALGHRALRRFLEESDLDAPVRRSRGLLGGSEDLPLLLAEPDERAARGPESSRPEGAEDYLAEVIRSRLRSSIPVILVLPKWQGTPIAGRGGVWVEKVTLLGDAAVEEVLGRALPAGMEPPPLVRRLSSAPLALASESAWGERLEASLIAPQLLGSSPALKPVVTTAEGILVGMFRPVPEGGALYVVSDPDLLNNHGLPRGDNGVIIHRLLTRFLGARGVIFDEIVHGLGREVSFLSETLRFPLVLILIHGALVFLLVVWAGLSVRGKPLPAPPRLASGPEGLIENTAGLLASRGRLEEAGARYFELVLQDVTRRFRRGHFRSGRLRGDGESAREDLLEEAQGLSRRRGRRVDLQRLRDRLTGKGARGRREAGIVPAALTLHRWREEMLSTHGS